MFSRASRIPIIPLALFAATTLAAGNWSQFLGPNGNGHAWPTSQPPVQWSESQNVAWKTPIHDKGWSSPVVWGNQIWLTTATEDGHDLYVLCIDRQSGEVLLDRKLFDIRDPQFCHKFNSYASPTPVVSDGRVYVTFGSPGTACLDTESFEVLWTRTDFECNHYRGAGSSPIVHDNLLIMNFDGSDHQYVAALDRSTGETVWRVDRSIDFQDLGPDGKPVMEGDLRKAFSTPHIAEIQGRPVLVSIGAKAVYGYAPATGEELFRLESRMSHSASTRPAVQGDRIFYATGFPRGHLWGFEVDSSFEVSEEDLLWDIRRSVPNKPSPLLIGDRIFMIDDGGIASWVDIDSGELLWNERVGGNYSASPIYANGHIYCFSEEGKGVVLKSGDSFEVVAENELPDGFMASPAVDGDSLILRTRTHLYRIEE